MDDRGRLNALARTLDGFVMRDGTFALVPIEVVADKRLTLEQTRVLIALFSFRGKNTDTVWPSRNAIAERTGMHPSNISTATSMLVSLGWLRKDGIGGRSKATRYTITVPDLDSVAEQATVSGSATVVQSATVADAATVAERATRTVAERATRTVAHSARGIEQTSEQTNEQTNDAPPVPVVAPKTKDGAKKSSLTPAMQDACRRTWEAYTEGYVERYMVEPTFNGKVAGQVVGFVKRVGMDEAPRVARWFPSHQSSYYVGRGHVVDCLLRDAEKLRTEWATGRVMTAGKARQSDRAGTTMAALAEVLAEQGETL